MPGSMLVSETRIFKTMNAPFSPTKKKKFYSYLQDESRRLEIVEKDLNARLRQQEAIAWLGEYAIKSTDLNTLFTEAVRLVAETLDVELVKILQLLPDGKEMLLRAGVGWKEGLVGVAHVGAGSDSHAGYTLLEDEPVIVSDMRTENRFRDPHLLLDYGGVSGMSAVIRGRERPWGVLGTHSIRWRTFTPHDTRFLISIASILASAIERFRTEYELRRSRDELAIILNGVSEGVTVQAPDGSLLYANNTAARMVGYASLEELTSKSIQEVMEQFDLLDDAGNACAAINLPGHQVFQAKKAVSARVRFCNTKSGEEDWLIVDANPIYDADGNVVQAVNIFRNITDLVSAEQSQKVLIEAGKLFAESLHYKDTVEGLANLVITNIADWCSVHLVTKEEQVEEITVVHKDPRRIQMARELRERYPVRWDQDAGIPRVLRTGVAEYYPEITEEMLIAGAQDAEHMEFLRSLGFRAAMIVPLNARNRTLGTITLVWSDSGRKYNQREVDLIQELANRAALAIENLRLFQETQNINTELEERVSLRTRQLVAEIEERKKAEVALRKSQDMLNSLFESAPDATILVDRSGNIMQVNRQAENVFGYRRDELVGTNVERLLPQVFNRDRGQHRDRYFNQATARLMGGKMDFSALRRDGTEFPADVMLSPIQTEEGELVISAARDITEQKRLQTELAETHRRLFESVEAERRLLSQELHDGPLQDLYGVALFLEGMRATIPEGGENEFESCKDSVQTVIQTLRAICGNLRPPALSHFGLEKTIRSHLIKFQDAHPELAIEMNLENDRDLLSDRTRLALYRVYQNSMTNILRHANAKKV